MQLKDILEQLPIGQKVSSPEDNLADNLILAAKVFGHDAVFGSESEGELNVWKFRISFRFKRKPITIAKLGQLLVYLEKERKNEEREMEKAKRRGKR